uniref:DUF4283 domain-containing protein n=1 Tax=Cannabis sativa TaxID=3483 RepID=A0A803Q799_CANSA
MAKTRATKQGKPRTPAKKKKKRGPGSSSEVKKTKSMDEVLGIEPIIFSEDSESGDEEQGTGHDYEIQRGQEDARRDSISIIRNLESRFSGSTSKQKVKITSEDIQEEVEYWTPSIVCYVLGANPPMTILDGYVRRVWKDRVDKVGMISYGVFLVRFNSIADRDEILSGGYTFFNNRPVIMRAWDPNKNFRKEDIHSVPIWVQLQGLELKYWGEQVLFRIIRQIGEPVMLDSFTKAKEKLNYPRILIEVSLNQHFPEQIEFEDEYGDDISIFVKYEWKPTVCTHCKGVGHVAINCRKKEGNKTEWVVKKPAVETRAKPTSDEDGFVLPKKIWKEKLPEAKEPEVIAVANTFGGLQHVTDQEEDDGEIEGENNVLLGKERGKEIIGNTRGGGEPPLPNG